MFAILYANNKHDNIFVFQVVMYFMKRSNTVIVQCCCLLLMIFHVQCKKIDETSDPENDQTNQAHVITEQDIIDFEIIEYALSDQSQNITENWTKYIEFSTYIEELKKGQLAFFKDDKAIMTGLMTDLRSEIPESINKPSVLVRIAVLETTMSKLDESANIRSTSKETLLENIRVLLESYNNLIFQINKEVERDAQIINKS